MKKLVLMTMVAVSMTTFASLQENDNRLEGFVVEYQKDQGVDTLSKEMPEDLVVTDVREFFRDKLNNYDE